MGSRSEMFDIKMPLHQLSSIICISTLLFNSCQGNGEWGSWSSWRRERECLSGNCVGNNTETGDNQCIVAGLVTCGAWSEWGQCPDSSCSLKRTKECTNTCDKDIDLGVTVRNGLNNELLPEAKVSIIRVEEDEEIIITEGAKVNADGLTSALVNKNGHYIIKVEADGFIASEREIEVDCDLTECDRCTPRAFVPLSPHLEAGALRFSLSWAEKPNDLDLYAYRRNWRDWDQSCETYWRKKTGCNEATLDLDNTRGGNNGAETITLKEVENQKDNVYMIFVNNFVASRSAEFKHSEAHVTITDGIVSHNLDLHPANHQSENWWLAGCLRFSGDSYEFMALDVFFDSKPSEEVSDMCLENFGYHAPTTEKPWYQFWG